MNIEYVKPIVIAEIGCNHKGDIGIAKEMICMAKELCGAEGVKFQKRNNKELLTEEQYNAPHPVPENSYGKTYGEHREFLEFSIEQHSELKEYCEKKGIIYSTSVWDMTSAKEIAAICPDMIKIPSASNNYYDMISWLCDNYKGELHISLGMTTRAEEKEIVSLLCQKGRNEDTVLYACTSGYPVPYSDVALLEIKRIREAYGSDVKNIGFSGHHLGTDIDIAAYTLGAGIIERHYTLDKTWKGTDHSASLEKEELKELVTGLNNVYSAMKYKETEILPIEQVQREKLKYRRTASQSKR